jgi:hypothetical protein
MPACDSLHICLCGDPSFHFCHPFFRGGGSRVQLVGLRRTSSAVCGRRVTFKPLKALHEAGTDAVLNDPDTTFASVAVAALARGPCFMQPTLPHPQRSNPPATPCACGCLVMTLAAASCNAINADRHLGRAGFTSP